MGAVYQDLLAQNDSAVADYHGAAIAGPGGTAIAGNCGGAFVPGGMATVGDCGIAAIAGRGGYAFAGIGGCAAAGETGTIFVQYRDDEGMIRTRIGYIGEAGLLPGILYRLNDKHEFVADEPHA
jgi:hypothetical protein